MQNRTSLCILRSLDFAPFEAQGKHGGRNDKKGFFSKSLEKMKHILLVEQTRSRSRRHSADVTQEFQKGSVSSLDRTTSRILNHATSLRGNSGLVAGALTQPAEWQAEDEKRNMDVLGQELLDLVRHANKQNTGFTGL